MCLDFYEDYCQLLPDGKTYIPDHVKFRHALERPGIPATVKESGEWLLAIFERQVEEDPNFYSELHHLIAKAMKGHLTDSRNLVRLLAKHHLLAHGHLCVCFPNEFKLKQAFLAMADMKRDGRNWTSESVAKILKNEKLFEAYAEAKRAHAEYMKGNQYAVGHGAPFGNQNGVGPHRPGAGAPLGNQYAVGHGAPLGNQNAVGPHRPGGGRPRKPPSNDDKVNKKRENDRKSYLRKKQRKSAENSENLVNSGG